MLSHWNPIHHLLNDLEFTPSTHSALSERGTLGRRAPSQAWSATDITETPEALLIHVDVPGLRSEDVSVRVHESVLTLEAERAPLELPEGTRHHAGRRFGALRRSYRLAPTLDASATCAEVADGVLSIRVPKVPKAQPLEIEVL